MRTDREENRSVGSKARARGPRLTRPETQVENDRRQERRDGARSGHVLFVIERRSIIDRPRGGRCRFKNSPTASDDRRVVGGPRVFTSMRQYRRG